jgi:hypothetical protein
VCRAIIIYIIIMMNKCLISMQASWQQLINKTTVLLLCCNAGSTAHRIPGSAFSNHLVINPFGNI